MTYVFNENKGHEDSSCAFAEQLILWVRDAGLWGCVCYCPGEKPWPVLSFPCFLAPPPFFFFLFIVFWHGLKDNGNMMCWQAGIPWRLVPEGFWKILNSSLHRKSGQVLYWRLLSFWSLQKRNKLYSYCSVLAQVGCQECYPSGGACIQEVKKTGFVFLGWDSLYVCCF